MKKKTKAELATIKANKAFNKLSPQQKRISIAYDAIQQILMDKFQVKCGVYLEMENLENFDSDAQLKQAIPESNNCQVCAKGALFASCVLKNNHFTVGQANSMEGSDGNDKIFNHLKGIFSKKQLDLIECAFEKEPIFHLPNYLLPNFDVNDKEGESYNSRGNYDKIDDYMEYEKLHPDAKLAMEFGDRFEDDKTRLLAILTNILANKGTFIP
jgi:hypothetical protein